MILVCSIKIGFSCSNGISCTLCLRRLVFAHSESETHSIIGESKNSPGRYKFHSNSDCEPRYNSGILKFRLPLDTRRPMRAGLFGRCFPVICISHHKASPLEPSLIALYRFSGTCMMLPNLNRVYRISSVRAPDDLPGAQRSVSPTFVLPEAQFPHLLMMKIGIKGGRWIFLDFRSSSLIFTTSQIPPH